MSGRESVGCDLPPRRIGDRGTPTEPIRTDFSGYEGKYVAADLRARQVVMADDDYNQLADRTIAEGVNHRHASIRRVPAPDEPQYVGLGSADQVFAKDVEVVDERGIAHPRGDALRGASLYLALARYSSRGSAGMWAMPLTIT
jgi:hypothetical protein